MLRLSLIISIVILIASCSENTDTGEAVTAEKHPMKEGFYSKLKPKTDLDDPKEEAGLGKIIWDKEEHDFGEVTEGDLVTYSFEFTNTGKGPLEILKADSRCGCTVANWTEEPIMPGQKGKLTAVFDSKHLMDQQSKAIIVHTNGTPSKTALVVRAFVKPKS